MSLRMPRRPPSSGSFRHPRGRHQWRGSSRPAVLPCIFVHNEPAGDHSFAWQPCWCHPRIVSALHDVEVDL